jgi:hypothetical protein
VKVVLAVGLPPLERQLEELKELGTPDEDSELLETFYKETEKAIDEATQNPKSMLTSETNPFNKTEETAARYGFKTCGSA